MFGDPEVLAGQNFGMTDPLSGQAIAPPSVESPAAPQTPGFQPQTPLPAPENMFGSGSFFKRLISGALLGLAGGAGAPDIGTAFMGGYQAVVQQKDKERQQMLVNRELERKAYLEDRQNALVTMQTLKLQKDMDLAEKEVQLRVSAMDQDVFMKLAAMGLDPYDRIPKNNPQALKEKMDLLKSSGKQFQVVPLVGQDEYLIYTGNDVTTEPLEITLLSGAKHVFPPNTPLNYIFEQKVKMQGDYVSARNSQLSYAASIHATDVGAAVEREKIKAMSANTERKLSDANMARFRSNLDTIERLEKNIDEGAVAEDKIPDTQLKIAIKEYSNRQLEYPDKPHLWGQDPINGTFKSSSGTDYAPGEVIANPFGGDPKYVRVTGVNTQGENEGQITTIAATPKEYADYKKSLEPKLHHKGDFTWGEMFKSLGKDFDEAAFREAVAPEIVKALQEGQPEVQIKGVASKGKYRGAKGLLGDLEDQGVAKYGESERERIRRALREMFDALTNDTWQKQTIKIFGSPPTKPPGSTFNPFVPE